MAIVINDFEVVPAPPSTERGSGGGNDADKSQEKPTAEEVLRKLRERHERVRAH